MKTLLKWNFLIVLFMMCSVPLLVGCGDDDDDPTDPDDVTTVVIGWKEIGNNKATFGFTQSYAGIKWSGLITMTFNGSGDDATCTKCVVEETWPREDMAKASEDAHKTDGSKNVSRSGKKVSYEEDGFIGLTRGELKIGVKAFGGS